MNGLFGVKAEVKGKVETVLFRGKVAIEKREED